MVIGSQGDHHVGHQSCASLLACTRDWGIGGAQHAIQHTEPHPDCQISHSTSKVSSISDEQQGNCTARNLIDDNIHAI